MKRKNLLYLFFVVLGLSLAACQGSQLTTTVSFRTSGDPAEQAAFETLVAAFQEKHPEIQVELTHIPSDGDYRARLVTDFAAGTAPDVTLMNYRRIANFTANNLLEPLSPFLDESELIKAEDFYPVAMEAFRWQGQIMCIPQNISSLAVYYNQNLFDEAGVAYPADDWSWDDFVAAAKALTQDKDGDGRMDQYGVGIEASLYRVAPFVWQNSSVIVDQEAIPTHLTLTRAPALDALQWFVDLRQVHGVVPDRVEEESQNSESRFIAGTTAMFFDSRRGTPTYREIDSFTWDVAPLPHSERLASILHSDGYCLSASAKDKEAAWTFIEFANSSEGQTIIAGTGRTVPSLIAVAESDAFLSPGLLPEHSRVWLDNAAILQRVPVMSTWPEIEGIANEEIERAFYGDITAEEAANIMTQRTNEYFFSAQFAGQPGD